VTLMIVKTCASQPHGLSKHYILGKDRNVPSVLWQTRKSK